MIFERFPSLSKLVDFRYLHHLKSYNFNLFICSSLTKHNNSNTDNIYMQAFENSIEVTGWLRRDR